MPCLSVLHILITKIYQITLLHCVCLLWLCLCLSLRKAGVKCCLCTFSLGNAASWTCYRQSVRHSVPVDRTQSSNSSCWFWKLCGGQRCHGVPRSGAVLTIFRINKRGNTRTSELLLSNRQTNSHCTCETEEMVNTLGGFAVNVTKKNDKKILLACFAWKTIYSS